MPVGIPSYFEGDIINVKANSKEKPFGIFEVDIESPDNLHIPLLQTRIKTNNGYRTISPIGNWSGKYFSDELYNAEKFGYKFKVKRGYLFEKGDIFSEYVDFLYNLKKNSQKGSPNYIISKLLLNSLYGRLGMSPINEQHLILKSNSEEANKCYSSKNITNVLNLKNGKELISYFNEAGIEKDSEFSSNKNLQNLLILTSIKSGSKKVMDYINQLNNYFGQPSQQGRCLPPAYAG